MKEFLEYFRQLGWVNIVIVLAVTTLVWYLSRRRVEKMERDLFGDDVERYRADKNGVSPFDRPPKGSAEAKAKADKEALEKAKKGASSKPIVKELKRRK